jgi:DNA invertase Pin-like site-specific DNA recombinase
MNTEKITPWHRERLALVYVRQSTLTQVLHSRESQQRQYQLKEYATTLGFRLADVIDEDLGRSGSGLVERPGFARLLERVCTGEVGAVLALEASRLARNNRDWHHLVDLCAMTNTLVIDYDGIYDARLLNDRLLLGLKGTMSEFELGLLRQRAQQALRQKIARGEVLHVPPIGYERTEDNGLEITPDLQIQQAIRGVFARFRECSSARQVLLACRQEGVLLPTRDLRGRVVWQPVVWGRIVKFLKNPTYAGVYAYGRTSQRIVVENGREKRTGGHARAREDWTVLIRDHHEGYMTWSEYETNQQKLHDNLAARGKLRSAAKGGQALLAGLLRCGHCGRPLVVNYSGKVGERTWRYCCKGANVSYGSSFCISIGSVRMDRKVGEAVLAALEPAGIEASLEAERLGNEQLRRERASIALALEKARYEADRGRRQFEAVEPENRLVAAEVERRWNAALEQAQRLEQALQEKEKEQAPLAAAEVANLRALGADLAAAWDNPAAPVELKKRILRAVIEEIIVRIDPTADDPSPTSVSSPDSSVSTENTVTLTLHWAGGAHTELRFYKWSQRHHDWTTKPDAIELIRKLAPTCPDEQIASILNRGGHRTGKGMHWKNHSVQHVRLKNAIPVYKADGDRTWLTMQQAAAELQMSPNSIRRLIRSGVLPAQQITAHAPWIIAPESLRLPRVKAIAGRLQQTGLLKLPIDATNNLELSLS